MPRRATSELQFQSTLNDARLGGRVYNLAEARPNLHSGNPQICMIEGVVELGTELDPDTLSYAEILRQVEVKVNHSRSPDNPYAGIADHRICGSACQSDKCRGIEPLISRLQARSQFAV